LKTFVVDLETSVRLGGLMPARVLRVAESGIESAADVARLRAAGFGAFLIGNSDESGAAGMELRGLVGAVESPTQAKRGL